jgi:hypothetical protein
LQRTTSKKNKKFNCKRKEKKMSTAKKDSKKATAKKTTEQKIVTDIKKLVEIATVENVQKIFNEIKCDDFAKSLTKSELLKVVIYNEIKKAIDNDTHEAILQCVYDCKKSEFANSYNLIRFVEKEKHQNALTNIYITVKQDTVFCKCTVSANKTYQDALAKANYNIIKHFKIVELKDLTNEIKTLYAIFNSTH